MISRRVQLPASLTARGDGGEANAGGVHADRDGTKRRDAGRLRHKSFPSYFDQYVRHEFRHLLQIIEVATLVGGDMLHNQAYPRGDVIVVAHPSGHRLCHRIVKRLRDGRGPLMWRLKGDRAREADHLDETWTLVGKAEFRIRKGHAIRIRHSWCVAWVSRWGLLPST